MEQEQATTQDRPSSLGSRLNEGFVSWARLLERYGPGLLIVTALMAHVLMVNNSVNARFDGMYQVMNGRFDRLDDQIAVLDDKMEERFEKMETTADDRHERMRAEADQRYDRMGAEADARYERSDQRADERFDRLLTIVRLYEGRISRLETLFGAHPVE